MFGRVDKVASGLWRVRRPDAVLTHHPLGPAQPDAVASALKSQVRAPQAVGSFDFGMDTRASPKENWQ